MRLLLLLMLRLRTLLLQVALKLWLLERCH
jgi:hypothetical protein